MTKQKCNIHITKYICNLTKNKITKNQEIDDNNIYMPYKRYLENSLGKYRFLLRIIAVDYDFDSKSLKEKYGGTAIKAYAILLFREFLEGWGGDFNNYLGYKYYTKSNYKYRFDYNYEPNMLDIKYQHNISLTYQEKKWLDGHFCIAELLAIFNEAYFLSKKMFEIDRYWSGNVLRGLFLPTSFAYRNESTGKIIFLTYSKWEKSDVDLMVDDWSKRMPLHI